MGHDLPKLTIWLAPDDETRERLEEAVGFLLVAAGEERPTFSPHLTVVSGRSNVVPQAALNQVVEGIPPLALAPAGPARCPDPTEPDFRIWTSFYLPVKDAAPLRALRSACRHAFGFPTTERSTEPHVSLAYTLRSRRAKEAWLESDAVRQVVASSDRLRFDALEVVRDQPSDDIAARMRSWRPIARAVL